MATRIGNTKYGEYLEGQATEHVKAVATEAKKGTDKIRAYRKEASRLSSMANKRVQRLEKAGLKDSPAYRHYVESGKRFGVRGKSYNEVQAEMARLRRFVEMESSTIRGANRVLKKMASITGVEYKDMAELKTLSKRFFQLADKAEQYIRDVQGMGAAIGYQRLWRTINEAQASGAIDLHDADQSIDAMVSVVDGAIQQFQMERTASSGLGTSFFNLLPEN